MQKIKLAVCMNDREYQKRLTSCLVGHYREQFELHSYSSFDQLRENGGSEAAQVLLTDEAAAPEDWEGALVCLTEEISKSQTEGRILFTEKYQQISGIVDCILQGTGGGLQKTTGGADLATGISVVAVYALSENEYQLPFALTAASVLSETHRVLVLDLQENSGLWQLCREEGLCGQGVEELLVMAEGGVFSKKRLTAAVFHKDEWDAVYPARDSICISSMTERDFLGILDMLDRATHYDVLVVSLGTRFQDFFQVLAVCHRIFLPGRQSGFLQTRFREFEEEIEEKGYREVLARMCQIKIPPKPPRPMSCEQLASEWKWSELGDMLRGMLPEGAFDGRDGN